MDTRTDEIADGIIRISTYIPDLAGLTFNQFVVRGEEPLLFHTGMDALFPLVSAAVERVVPLSHLRWLSFGHVEADECGALARFRAACPKAQIVHSVIGCAMTLDAGTAVPVPFPGGTALDLGGKRLISVETPHVPHGWDAHLLYEESTRTLLCGDLLAHAGNVPALIGGDEIDRIIDLAVDTERQLRQTAALPALVSAADRLAALEPCTLALMHGSAIAGDGQVLRSLARALTDLFADEESEAHSAGRLWTELAQR